LYFVGNNIDLPSITYLKPYGSSIFPPLYSSLDNDHGCTGYDTGTGRLVLGFREYLVENARMITFQFLEFPTSQIGPAVQYDSFYDDYIYPIQDEVTPNRHNKFVYPGITADTHLQTSIITTGAKKAFTYTAGTVNTSPILVKDYQNYIRPYYDIAFGASTVSSLLSFQYYIPSMWPEYGCSSLLFDNFMTGEYDFTDSGFVKEVLIVEPGAYRIGLYDNTKTYKVGFYCFLTPDVSTVATLEILDDYLPKLQGNRVSEVADSLPVTSTYFTNCEDYDTEYINVLRIYTISPENDFGGSLYLYPTNSDVVSTAITVGCTIFSIIT
jgi:hypothetical protein